MKGDENLAAKKYGVSARTIRNWRNKQAPFDDPEAMLVFIASERSRRGVSKFNRRTAQPIKSEAIAEVPIEIVPATQASLSKPSSSEADPGTLARLTDAERIAHDRYIASGGSERAGQVWLAICDQKRRAEETAAKITNDVSESDSKFLNACIEVISTLNIHLLGSPRLIAVLCEGLARELIEPKVQDHLQRTIAYAVSGILNIIKGTPLEAVFFNSIGYVPGETDADDC